MMTVTYLSPRRVCRQLGRPGALAAPLNLIPSTASRHVPGRQNLRRNSGRPGRRLPGALFGGNRTRRARAAARGTGGRPPLREIPGGEQLDVHVEARADSANGWPASSTGPTSTFETYEEALPTRSATSLTRRPLASRIIRAISATRPAASSSTRSRSHRRRFESRVLPGHRGTPSRSPVHRWSFTRAGRARAPARG